MTEGTRFQGLGAWERTAEGLGDKGLGIRIPGSGWGRGTGDSGSWV